MHIRPTRRSDLAAITRITTIAFIDGELNEFLWPGLYENRDAFVDEQAINNRFWFVAPGKLGFVAVLDAEDIADAKGFRPGGGEPLKVGDVVGVSWYSRFPDGPEYDPAKLPRSATLSDDEAVKLMRRDRARNTDLASAIERQALNLERSYIKLCGRGTAGKDLVFEGKFFASIAKDKTFAKLPSIWWLNVLATDPRAEGRGVGSMLVAEGKKLAEEAGVPLCLTSAPGRAERFYQEKEGFKVVGWGQIEDMNHRGGAHRVWDPTGKYMRPITPREIRAGKTVDAEWVG